MAVIKVLFGSVDQQNGMKPTTEIYIAEPECMIQTKWGSTLKTLLNSATSGQKLNRVTLRAGVATEDALSAFVVL